MKKIRWGLLSTARINRRLITPIRASKRGVLAAVASRELSTAKTYADKWDIPLAFGSYQEMLASGEIDAVYISLPNHLHAEWSIKALQAGVHVLCEKPFTTSLEETDAMIAASRQSGRYLAEAFMYRHHPQTKIAGEMAHSGKLGEVTVVRGVFNFKINDRNDVRLNPAWGGGCLWDVGIYPLSFTQFIYGGPPQSVQALQWLGDTGVDETFTGEMRYPGGQLAQIASSFRSPYHTAIEIIGTAGRLLLTRPFNALEDGRRMTFFPEDGKPQEIKTPRVELYSGEVEDLHSAVLDGQPQYLTLEETRNHMRTALALYEAACSGKIIDL